MDFTPEAFAGEIPADIVLEKPLKLDALRKEVTHYLSASKQLPV